MLLLACAGTASLDIVEVQLTVAEATPMVPVLTWEASEGAVEVVGPEASWVVSLGAPRSGVPILGLKPATRYELVPVGITAATQVFETPPAPDDLSGVQGELAALLMSLKERLDPESYGGAHLVGSKGVVVIAHGSSSELAIANAISMAAEGAEKGLVDRVALDLEA